LSEYSRCEVIVKCDFCGKEYSNKFSYLSRSYKRCISKKDACVDCVENKIKESFLEKYGMENPLKSQEIVNKRKQTCLEKYGEDNPSKVDFIKEKIVRVQLEKYGSLYNQTEEYKIRCEKTCMERYGVKSKSCLESSKRKGDKSPSWKGNLPNRDKRSLNEYREWRFSVFKRDAFLCQRCFIKRDVEAHHIKNWKDNELLRHEISNGITLCKQCHAQFHSHFGKKNTNNLQLEIFIEQYGKDVCRPIGNENQ